MTGITEYASSARICSDTCCNGNKIEFDSVRLDENGLDMSSQKCTVSRKPIPIFFHTFIVSIHALRASHCIRHFGKPWC